MSFSKLSEPSLFQRSMLKYIMLLQSRPILVKSCSSAVTSGLGNAIAEAMKSPDKRNWNSVITFAVMGFGYIGPASHFVYLLLEKLVAQDSEYAVIKRLLLERLLITPPFLLAYLYLLFLLEGKGHQSAWLKVKRTYPALLIMNWRVWTVLQFININFVPPMFRVLFGNITGLFWTIYLASKRR